jgi:hypothetical protein
MRLRKRGELSAVTSGLAPVPSPHAWDGFVPTAAPTAVIRAARAGDVSQAPPPRQVA